MEASDALALVRSARDDLVEVRDAPDKGAGVVGCFARLPCVSRCCAQRVPRRLQICCARGANAAAGCCYWAGAAATLSPRVSRLPPRTFLGSYAGRLVDLRRKDRVERLRWASVALRLSPIFERGGSKQVDARRCPQ